MRGGCGNLLGWGRREEGAGGGGREKRRPVQLLVTSSGWLAYKYTDLTLTS